MPRYPFPRKAGRRPVYPSDFVAKVRNEKVIVERTIELTPEKGDPGEPGEPGPGLYEAWLAAGNTGSLEQFLDAMKGEPGSPGADGYTPVKGVDYFDGDPGADGYTPVKGVDYDDGQQGPPGENGEDGRFAAADFSGLSNVSFTTVSDPPTQAEMQELRDVLRGLMDYLKSL